MEIILGSQSPRRKEILESFSLPFLQIPSPFVEEEFRFAGPSDQFVLCLSQEKAKALVDTYPAATIICADTIVEFKGKRLGKPRDRKDAVLMLREFSGGWQQVYTGITVQKGLLVFSDFEQTRVLFRALTDRQIHRYIDAVHAFDKAGAWAIQGKGELIVERIEGSYSNVVGFPIGTLRRLLMQVGIDLWEWL